MTAGKDRRHPERRGAHQSAETFHVTIGLAATAPHLGKAQEYRVVQGDGRAKSQMNLTREKDPGAEPYEAATNRRGLRERLLAAGEDRHLER